jgi:hypothetical protein
MPNYLSQSIYYGCWLPEKYVQGMLLNNSDSKKHLIPIEGFQLGDKNSSICLYGGEVNTLVLKKVKDNGINKFQIFYLQNLVNKKYDSEGWCSRFSNSKVYLSKYKEKLLVEIIEKNKTHKIYFINKINGYYFMNIRKAKEYLEKGNFK